MAGVDMSQFITAKSDQLNADDLLGGPITVRVTGVRGTNDKDQPIAISYEGDQGKPYKPGKSMRRVLVHFWGKEADAYLGRFMTLYRDPDVTFGKIKVGGIRIGAMSDIEAGEVALTATKGSKKLFSVGVLRQSEGQGNGGRRQGNTMAENVDLYIAAISDPKVVATLDDLRDYQSDDRRAKWIESVAERNPEQHARIVEANGKRFAELSPPAEDNDDDTSDNDREDDDPPGEDDDDDTFPGDR